MKPYLIVGAGFSGAVLARELATHHRRPVLIIDARSHVAGNCHTERDHETGVMTHRYGPHIFHTDRKDIWDYVNRFGEFHPFVNRVKASIKSGVYSLPINLHTINQFFGKRFSPQEASKFITLKGDSSIKDPANFEEQALRMIGKELYEAFFRGYTLKQWGCDPCELPASILKRLPIRFNYDDNYYNSRYQGIPVEGYSQVVENILNHPNIEVKTGVPFTHDMKSEMEHVFFTGPIDDYFGYSQGRLSYRTVFWETTVGSGDLQGNAVINYPDPAVPYTRIHEHKHFAPWEKHEKSLIFTEYSKETTSKDIPYYPKRLTKDKDILNGYISLAMQEPNVSFLGRLATYRYLDMHQVIAEALSYAGVFLSNSDNLERRKFGGELSSILQ